LIIKFDLLKKLIEFKNEFLKYRFNKSDRKEIDSMIKVCRILFKTHYPFYLLIATRQGFADTRQGFAAMCQGFADMRQGFADTRQGFADTRQGFADTRQGFADTRQGFADTRQHFCTI
jgi:hypothetical protein